MTDLGRELVIRGPDDGEALSILGWSLRILLRAEQTGGQMGLIEGRFPAGADGPPAHRDGHDELFVVLEGEFRFQIEQEVIQVQAGSTLFIPEGTLHTFKNEAGALGRLMGAFLPGGYERYFEDLSRLTNAASPDFAQMAELAARHGTTYVGPPAWQV